MVDTSHQQLSDNILVNTGEIPNNGVDDDQNGYVDDDKGVQINTETNDPVSNRHGSHVSGIIVADPAKGPVSGVAPKAKVVPAQFISNNGGGSIGDAIVALNYVASRGAKIINMSWGMDPCIDIPNLRSTLKDLNSQGILLITAAGNGDERGVGINMDITPSFPSAYNFSNQINVAASTTNQILAGFSNYGINSVDVSAPGVGIYSTTPQNQIETMSGTSMAAPMVSGAAALLMSAIPTATAAQVKQALMSAVIRPPTPLNVKSGGVINVYDALTALKTITGVVIP
jgi:subtilisin family serine protease